MCGFVVILFILEHSKHLKQDVLRELHGCFRDVCLKFQECLEVSRVFQGSFGGNFECVSRKFKGYSSKIEGHCRYFYVDSRVFEESSTGKFQGCFQEN